MAISQSPRVPRALAWFGALGLVAVAAVNFARRRQAQPAASRAELHTFADDRSVPASAGSWSTHWLQSLDPDVFETLCAAYYARRGFRVEMLHGGGGQGVDARLFFGSVRGPVAIMRCIAQSGGVVGVQPVQELVGAMTKHSVPKGILHAAGDFAPEAAAYAAARRVQLVSGSDFVRNVSGLPPAAQNALRDLATQVPV